METVRSAPSPVSFNRTDWGAIAPKSERDKHAGINFLMPSRNAMLPLMGGGPVLGITRKQKGCSLSCPFCDQLEVFPTGCIFNVAIFFTMFRGSVLRQQKPYGRVCILRYGYLFGPRGLPSSLGRFLLWVMGCLLRKWPVWPLVSAHRNIFVLGIPMGWPNTHSPFPPVKSTIAWSSLGTSFSREHFICCGDILPA